MNCVNNFGSPASTTGSTVTPFTLAKKATLTKEKVAEFHRAVTKFVESPWFR